MNISLFGPRRVRFSADLRAHRETFSLNDAEYADQVLKVSLNTYKKCVKSRQRGPHPEASHLRQHLCQHSLGSEKLRARDQRS